MGIKHRVDDLATIRKGKIEAELDELDKKAIRALMEIASGTDTDEDHEKLTELRSEKEKLRAKLRELSGV